MFLRKGSESGGFHQSHSGPAGLVFCFPEHSTSSYLASLLISYLAAIPLIYLLQSLQHHILNHNFPFNSNICFHEQYKCLFKNISVKSDIYKIWLFSPNMLLSFDFQDPT